MRLRIEHVTEYLYTEKVYLEPHYLQLYPQSRSYYQVDRHDISITPATTGLSKRLDLENNLVGQCWFQEAVDQFTVTSLLEVTVIPFNPFDFLVDTDYTGQNPYSFFLETPEDLSADFTEWLESVQEVDGTDPLRFSIALNEAIHAGWSHEIRKTPNIMSSSECFEYKRGSCRDLTWMMMMGLRYAQIPSRFVSGYAFNPELGTGHELHAWVEAGLPGAGWIGLDPSSGLLCDETYIPMHASHHPKNTLPVIGNYRGDAESTLSTKVLIRQL